MKACINDNTEDSSEQNPNFYHSSMNLETAWKNAGNKVEATYLSGGHCQFHSFATILDCLDDGTGRLLANGPINPDPTPVDPKEACIDEAAKVCPDLKGEG